MYDPQVDALGEVTWIPGRQYPEPTFIGRTALPSYGTPYHITNWGMKSTQLVIYEAPAFTNKSNQALPIKRIQSPDIGTQQGSAPITSGIPASGCTANGMGGNPYS
jgi:hypothetical protein